MIFSSQYGSLYSSYGVVEYATKYSSQPHILPTSSTQTGLSAQKVSLGAKTPDELKTWAVDWSGDLGNDTVGESSWEITPNGCSVLLSGTYTNDRETVALLSGGEVDQLYYVQNTIITVGGSTLTKVFRLLVETAVIQ